MAWRPRPLRAELLSLRRSLRVGSRACSADEQGASEEPHGASRRHESTVLITIMDFGRRDLEARRVLSRSIHARRAASACAAELARLRHSLSGVVAPLRLVLQLGSAEAALIRDGRKRMAL